jgi:endonuclease/exonuclease/phosphatase (EEP) superfamily protein YafD
VAIYEAPEELTPEQFDGLFAGLPVRSLPGKRASNGWPLIRRSAMAVRAGPAIDTVMYDGSHGVLMRASLRGVQITSTHPPSPGDPGLRADRDRQLADISAGIDLDRPYIVAGDFNATPWSAAYETVPGARAGDPRFEGTFPAFLGALGLPIDHIKFGGGLVLVDYRAGPDIGSDHLPLVATFALPGN